MNGYAIIAGIFVAAFAAAAGGYLVFRFMGVELRRRHLEVGTTIFLQLGVIYAVFLAFVFGQALTSFVAADDAIDTECAALHGAAILAAALPSTARAELANAMNDYVTAVVEDEWPSMQATRRGSPRAFAQEEHMLRKANGLDLQAERDIRNQTRIVERLVDAHKSREERLFEAGQGIPAGLWAMILVYCGVLVGLVFFSSLEYAMSHAAISGIYGGLNALVLLAVFALQYPFEGPFRLGPDSFVLTKAKLAATFAQ